MAIIPQIFKKRKSHYTTKSGVILKQNKKNEKCIQDKPPKNHENNCYRCGMKRHWLCTCRKPKHLVDLYQTLVKAKGKKIEMNFTDGDGLVLTYYAINAPTASDPVNPLLVWSRLLSTVFVSRS